jgi:hypothetical protein
MECGCSAKEEKKEQSAQEMLMTQPPAVWIALAIGFVLATAIKK